MQITKVFPFLNFQATDKGLRKSDRGTDREPNQGGSGYQSPERQATEEEAKQAQEILRSTQQILDNKLLVNLIQENGIFSISVQDQGGQQLKRLKGGDILRVLTIKSDNLSKESGRILDRRI